MKRNKRVVRWTTTAALALALGCAGSPQAPPVAPAPRPTALPTPERPPEAVVITQAFDLTPPESARRTADRVQLTGRELGTMWTFENPPLDYWQKEYGFTATKEWLDHVRLSSVRYGTYCSASFVSPDGLVMTNHHCARECVEQQSSPGNDYVVKGFYARTRSEERLCEGLFLDQLVAIDDVTPRVRAMAPPAGASDAQIAQAIAGATDQIESECGQRTGNTCQVVELYQGGQYQLYQYKRYQPVKLVFAPELQAGFFGGDPDNFTYPRYALDVSFVRAYDSNGNTPARTPDYFRWRAEGAGEKETVFVTGNPGSTSRLTTVAQLMYERVYRHPFLVQITSGQRNLLQAYAAADPQAAAEVRQELFEVENSLKAYRGELAGLRDSVLVGIKVRWEREFRAKLEADPKAKAEFGDLWARIEDIQRQKLVVSPGLNVANWRLIGGPHMAMAAQLVYFTRENAKPEAQQDPQFRARAAQLRSMLEAASPFPPDLARLMLRGHLEVAHDWLPAGDALRALLLGPGESADAAANRLVSTSRVLDPAFRKALLEGGSTAVDASTDPLIAFARTATGRQREDSVRWQNIQAAETVQKQRLARALFAAYGTSLPPDATFTLRISDGRVMRYEYNGTYAPPVTSYFGLYGRAAEFGNQMPWTLPDAFARAAKTVNLATPLDFVSTTDITGGNSGSPMIDTQGRVVGLVFDGNVEQLPNEYVFRGEAGRTIAVHSAGILEALRNVYGADALLRELTGQIGAPGARE